MPAPGMLGFSPMAAPDLATSQAVGEKYYPAAGALTDVRCYASGGSLILEGIERFAEPALQRFLREKLFASARVVTRALAGADHRPQRLELRYAQPALRRRIPALFRLPDPFQRAVRAPVFRSGAAAPSHRHAQRERTCARLIGDWLPRPPSTRRNKHRRFVQARE